MKSNLHKFFTEQWNASQFFPLRSQNTAANFLLESLATEAGDYFICDPFVPTFLLDAIKQKKGKTIFIDLEETLGDMDIKLLEDFLSLSTLINEKDELIYRKDERPIKAIISSTRWQNTQNLQTFLFTAQRYYLKTIAVTDLNDLLVREAKNYYQADLVTGSIEAAGIKAQIIFKSTLQANMPALVQTKKTIKMPDLGANDIVSMENFQLPDNILGEITTQPSEVKSVQLPLFIPGQAKVLHQNREKLRVYLTANGFFYQQPFLNRKETLQQSTFMSRSKAGQKYLDQSIEILITHPKEVKKLIESLDRYNQTMVN